MAAINLFDLFSGKVFRIPDFQRGYAWEEKQLVELWDDLDELEVDTNGDFKKHYTGTIYLEETAASPNEKWLTGVTFFRVIDGQQRLTTISIFILELLQFALDNGYNERKKEKLLETFIYESNSSGKSRIYKFCYDPGDRNFRFLLSQIFEDTSIVSDGNVNLYAKNLAFAKSFFSNRIKSLDHSQRETLFKKLTTALHFDVRLIERDLDVQAVFETMNNRGKPLSTLEKLKNRLIYLSAKLRNSTAEDKTSIRSKINDAWGKIYSSLAQNPDYVLDEDIYLSAHLSLYRKPKEAVFSEKSAEEKIFQMFCNKPEKFDMDESGIKEPPVDYNKIEDFILKLSEAAPAWYSLHNSDLPLLKKVLLLNNSKEVKVLLLALLLKLSQVEIRSFLMNLERLLFRNKVLWLFDERTTASWAREIYLEEEKLEHIKSQVQELIASPIPGTNVIQAMNNLFTYERGNKGFHRWGGLKYFLFEYEDELQSEFKEDNKKVTLDQFEAISIEHIIPQQFTDHWGDVVRGFNDGLETNKIELANKILINTLGNLTILKGGKNSSIGNSGWKEKKNRFRYGSYNEIEISKSECWTKKEILDRGIKLTNFLEKKVLGLKFTEDEKLKLLFFDNLVIEAVSPKMAKTVNDLARVAFHEAAHAFLAHGLVKFPGEMSVVVFNEPHGGKLGVTTYPKDKFDNLNMDHEKGNQLLRIAYGGCIGEELYCQQNHQPFEHCLYSEADYDFIENVLKGMLLSETQKVSARQAAKKFARDFVFQNQIKVSQIANLLLSKLNVTIYCSQLSEIIYSGN